MFGIRGDQVLEGDGSVTLKDLENFKDWFESRPLGS